MPKVRKAPVCPELPFWLVLMIRAVGKQTFNSLFGKAKAKYAELQATQAAEREGKSRPRESTWGENGSGYGGVRGGQRQDQAWRQPPPAMNDRGVEPNQRGKLQGNGLWGDSAS